MKKKIAVIFISIIVSVSFILPINIFAEVDKSGNSAQSEIVRTEESVTNSETKDKDNNVIDNGETNNKKESNNNSEQEIPKENSQGNKIQSNILKSPMNIPLNETEWFKLGEEIRKAENNKRIITIDKNITADLVKDNGHTIFIKKGQNIILKGKGNIKGIGFSSIKIMKGGSLTIDGPSLSNTQIIVEGNLNLNNGKISETKLEGPSIFVNSGKFTMSGGEIKGNEALESQSPKPQTIRKDEVNDYYKYSPITIYSGTFKLSGGKIAGNKGFLRGGAIGVWGTETSKAKVEISGGEIKDNIAIHPRKYAWGGAIYIENCQFKMKGGTISKNSAEFGGGINAVKSDLTLLGGNITENTNGEYKGHGGGIYASSSDINIKYINISKNNANGPGGGIFATSSKDEKHNLNIYSGSFKNNKAVNDRDGASGGGICVNNYNCKINGGEFIENSAERIGGAICFGGESNAVINAGIFKNNESNGFWGGGAIYNDNKSKLVINRALIKNNRVDYNTYLIGAGNHPPSRQGGGIWNCPAGNTDIYITNGLAIFDNIAPDSKSSSECKGAGDDFVNITKYQYGSPVGNLSKVRLASRMLGGGSRLWYQDGSFYGVHTNLEESQQKPRYNPENPGEPLPYNTDIEEKLGSQLAYKSVPTDESKSLAQQVATSIFTGNRALGTGISGGCITNNGKLIFGEDTPYKLKIIKSWTGDNSENRPKEIILKMYVGKHYVQDIKLTKEENWEKVIGDFPDPDTLVDNKTGKILPINFKEKDSSKYVLSVVRSTKNKKESTYTIELNNAIYTSVKVTKKWVDNNGKDGKRPDNVKIGLFANGKYTGKSIILSKKDNWKGVFEKLPLYSNDRLIDYQIKEISKVKGYTNKIEKGISEENKGDEINYIVTNTKIPEKKIPPKKKTHKKSPDTGDRTNIVLYSTLFVLAILLFIILGIIKKKKR